MEPNKELLGPISQQSLIHELFEKIKREQYLSDEILRELNVLFQITAAGALEILDNNKAIKLVASPSERYLYAVNASNKSKVKTYYTCIPPSYCSCVAFLYGIKKKEFYCKHLLAVQLLEALGSAQTEDISDTDFALKIQ
ncbi:zinc finger SWIM domain-containing protein [Acrasis kona]|uniref:Zinc finger SWIM domain-containing protein n=1 Tax=Acrasis kona TaxID=1008807 RepID=A0AAW2YLY0_9EUKA